jgi:hypothetical protein
MTDMVTLLTQRKETAFRAMIDGTEVSFATKEEKFRALARVWIDYNFGRSVSQFHHAAYLQIIGMGMPVVPLLLQDLANGAGDWLVALKYITGAKVTTPEMRGNFQAIQQAWINWGQANGFGPELR